MIAAFGYLAMSVIFAIFGVFFFMRFKQFLLAITRFNDWLYGKRLDAPEDQFDRIERAVSASRIVNSEWI